MYYCKHVETTLANENARLTRELNDANLDLEDARRSRRELQLECNNAKQRLSQFSMDNENLKVDPPGLRPYDTCVLRC